MAAFNEDIILHPESFYIQKRWFAMLTMKHYC